MSRARSLADIMDASGLIRVAKLENLPITSTTQQIFETAGTFTWTKPTGCKKIKVTVTGGGGGAGAAGGNDTSGTRVGGAGGGGGTAIKTIDVTSVTSVSVTVGAGGTRAANLNTYGTNGANSTFGTYCTGNGGSGGRGNDPDLYSGWGLSGWGGSASNGDLNIEGGCGIQPQNSGEISTNFYYVATIGGNSYLNNTRIFSRGTGGTTGGADGKYGSGGCGGVSQNSTLIAYGGSGGDGIVIVEEFYV